LTEFKMAALCRDAATEKEKTFAGPLKIRAPGLAGVGFQITVPCGMMALLGMMMMPSRM
jgi:hypothetical protein